MAQNQDQEKIHKSVRERYGLKAAAAFATDAHLAVLDHQRIGAGRFDQLGQDQVRHGLPRHEVEIGRLGSSIAGRPHGEVAGRGRIGEAREGKRAEGTA